jgi:RNA polymerase sigma factor (sigma-70 family)
LDSQELIRLCLLESQDGQKLLYEKYVAAMARLCLRYIRDEDEVQDILVEGFMKVFNSLKKLEYRDEYSLEAWIRKIMVNECLMRLRKKKKILFIDYSDVKTEPVQPGIDGLEAAEIIDLIQTLPEGYRTIFNLYVIDGYSHKEISELLGISESASRSQLTHARNKLKKLLKLQGWN